MGNSKPWVVSWKAELLGALLLACLLLVPLRATAEEEEDIPPSLRAWVPWVLSELGPSACVTIHDQPACVWPTTLALRLTSEGGTFEQEVVAGATAYHTLPGQRGAWPVAVAIDGSPAPVLEREGSPVLELKKGTHKIKGSFSWPRVPETFSVGENTAFLSLTMNGTEVPLIKREGKSIWLKGLSHDSSLGDQPEQVELSVFRQLRDDSFLTVETRLVFQVSGKAREISLQRPLIEGTLPLSVQGDLAVALEKSGALRVQLVPGRHTLTLVARAEGIPHQLTSQKRDAPWPLQEIWSWHPSTELRAVELSGAAGIDASRTDLPSEWREDSAYALSPGDSLRLTTTRRGQEQVPQNRLNLAREFWLDETANAFTVRDKLSGEMHQGWRLDLLHGELGQVSVSGESQVITHGPNGGHRGVEVRDAQLSLESVSRVSRSTELSIVGWSEDVDSLSTTIHLPPGWDLFAATGVDETSGTWVSRWNLFSVFFVLVLTLAMARLSGALGGVVTACALILAHDESGAPEYIWVALVVFSALLGLIEKGRFKSVLKIAFYSTGLVVLVMLVTFSVDQVRGALYPHLESDDYSLGDFEGALMQQEVPTDAPAAPPPDGADARMEEKSTPEPLEVHEDAAPVRAGSMGKSGGGLGTSLSFSRAVGSDYKAQKQFKPDAIVQTGPGIPEVTSSSWTLNFTGPVVKDHTIRLYLMSPKVQRVLTLLRLLLLFALGFLIFRHVHPTKKGKPERPKIGTPGTTAPRVAGAVFLLAFLGLPAPAYAEEPSDARLSQLKERLTRSPACAPDCVSVSSLLIEAEEEITLTAEVHAGAQAAYKLPGPAAALSSVRLKVDDKPSSAVRLHADGAYYLRLQKGVHKVTMTARLESEHATLDVGTPPERVTVKVKGWVVTGVSDTGRVEGGTLTFHREMKLESAKDADAEPAQAGQNQVAVPPYFLVTRNLTLGVSATVTTHVLRVSDASSPEILKLPLLFGERVTTPGIEVKAGIAEVPFPREAIEAKIVSSLSLPADSAPLKVALALEEKSSRSEIWTVQCGVVWHCQASGLTATSHIQGGHSHSTYHPWPGESLTLTATQPASAPGTSLTIRKANLTLHPGIRMSRGSLELALLTSRATVHTVTIPAKARLESVQVDGVTQAVKAENGKVRVSLSPGVRKVMIEWQEPHGLNVLLRSPKVDAGAPGVNFRVIAELPEERWLLFAGGPSQGPAILLWGYLLLILVAGWFLPRLPYAPLGRTAWVLLGLGLTQVPAPVALFVAGWFFYVGSRNSWPWFGRKRQNFLQFVLVAYTLGFLFCLTIAVYEGLVSSPDMEVRGAGSYNSHLVWYTDRSSGAFSDVWALTVSIWIWRAFMLAWALWLSKSLLSWLKWAWTEANVTHFWAPRPPGERPRVHGTPLRKQGSAEEKDGDGDGDKDGGEREDKEDEPDR